MTREAMIDAAIVEVFGNPNMLAVWRRYRMVTPSMFMQIGAAFRNIWERERSMPA
jgi:hypothetical protein